MLDNNKKCVPNDNVVSTGGGIDKCASAYRGICLACNAGFELNKNKCTPRFTDCNAGCSECSFDKAICYVCKPSYVIIPGMSCVSVTVTNCFLEDGYGNCLICNLSFTLKESQCVRDVSGCVLYDQNGNCLLCGGQMVSQGTICVGTINCLSYRSLTDTSKQCVKCSDGFTLD